MLFVRSRKEVHLLYTITVKSTSKKEQRSWVTSIVSALVAVVSLYISVISFRPDIASTLASITLGVFGILAIITAIQGKRKTLRNLLDSWFHLP